MKANQTLPERPPVRQPRQTPTTPPRRILIVEDNGELRCLIAGMLSRSGYAVDTAADGLAAWEALSDANYDLMITDNGMPRLTGIELLKKMRSALVETPVIMATGSLPIKDFVESPWLQPAATLAKPYSGDELLDVVEKVLRASNHARDRDDVSRWPAADGRDDSIPQYRIQVVINYPDSVLGWVGKGGLK